MSELARQQFPPVSPPAEILPFPTPAPSDTVDADDLSGSTDEHLKTLELPFYGAQVALFQDRWEKLGDPIEKKCLDDATTMRDRIKAELAARETKKESRP